MSWTPVRQSQYAQQLTGGGWTRSRQKGLDTYRRSGAAHAIVLITIRTQLVAVYGPPA
ncbi:MAG: hypothetical protein ACRDVG_07735 [Jatrophihabitantaceae bacterium]